MINFNKHKLIRSSVGPIDQLLMANILGHRYLHITFVAISLCNLFLDPIVLEPTRTLSVKRFNK